MKPIKILCPTGHLSFTPLEPGSFLLGCAEKPDFIIADAGSSDMGPRPLGADQHVSLEEWQRHDLEFMLVESRRLGVPMIVGSASDTGSRPEPRRPTTHRMRVTSSSPTSPSASVTITITRRTTSRGVGADSSTRPRYQSRLLLGCR